MRNFQFPINFQFSISNALNFLLKLFLFFLPWQTIYVYRWGVLNNTKWEYGTLGFYATEILLWIVIFLFIIWYCKRIKFQISNFKFQITSDRIFVLACLSLISYLFISIAWSADKSLALQQSVRVIEAFLLFFVLFLGPISFYESAKFFVLGSVVPAVLGIWQFLTQSTLAFKWLGLASHPVWEAGTAVIASDSIGRWLRAYGSFNHPNIFGGYLVIVIILLLFLYKKYQISNIKYQISLITIYCLLITALFFTFSRSAWLALGVGLLIYVFYHFITTSRHHYITTSRHHYITTSRHHYITTSRHHSSFIILSFIFFAILSTFYFPLIQTRFSNQSIYEIRSTSERVTGYAEAWQIFKQHPWLGVGAGNYTVSAHALNPNRPGWEYQPVHNAIILFATEQGVVGVGLLLFVVISFIIYQKIKKAKNQESKKLRNQCGVCFLVFLFSCFFVFIFFDHYLYSSYIGLMLTAVFFGLLLLKNSLEEGKKA